LVGGGGRAPDPWLTDNQDIAEGLSAAGLWVAAVSTDAAAEPVTVEMAISQANNAAPNRIDAPPPRVGAPDASSLPPARLPRLLTNRFSTVHLSATGT
jgi:hypothetical protein